MNIMQKWGFIALLFSYAGVPLLAQSNIHFNSNALNTQLGFSMKAIIEFGFYPKTKVNPGSHQNNPIIKIVANAGVASNFSTSSLYPSFNMEAQLYNGGHGSRRIAGRDNGPSWNVDLIMALTMTAGINNTMLINKQEVYLNRNSPLYYFADFVIPALQNPFDASFSVGTNLVFPITDKMKKRQRLGFLNLHVLPVQLSYYNDGGPPITNLYLGDRKDRYFTGGAVLSYCAERDDLFNLVELSYHKYTGYTKNAFEISNKLGLNFMNYHDREQSFYNKSIWALSASSTSKGFGFRLSNYDKIKGDVQHWIHWSINNAYHMVPYQEHWSISGYYLSSYTQLGMR